MIYESTTIQISRSIKLYQTSEGLMIKCDPNKNLFCDGPYLSSAQIKKSLGTAGKR